MNSFVSHQQFHTNSNVMSIVSHPPEIHPGTPVRIVNHWLGSLCAVQLPDGTIHRWFASFELRLENGTTYYAPGSFATVINTKGHGNPPHVEAGSIVRIVKCIPQISFYDVMLRNGEYHRWLAEFELAQQI